jgi:hypothetical protein
VKDFRTTKLGRRRLLKLGAAGLAAAVAGSAGALASAESDNVKRATRPAFLDSMALGYWSGAEGEGLVAANKLRSGQTSYAGREARVAVLGMCPETGAANCHSLASMAVDVDMQAEHGCDFQAWSMANSGVFNVGRSSRFTLPVDQREGVVLRVSYTAASAAESVSARVPLVAGALRGAAKLRDGYYVVVPGSPAPEWSRYRMTANGGPRLTVDGAPAAFPFVALRVGEA